MYLIFVMAFPEGSCLGPLLFNIYSSKIFDIVGRHLPNVHCYADDSQLYLSFNPSCAFSQDEAIRSMETCIWDVKQWMTSDKLMLNARGGGGDTHMKQTGMLAGNFEFNP